jgi:hypothetical protein
LHHFKILCTTVMLICVSVNRVRYAWCHSIPAHRTPRRIGTSVKCMINHYNVGHNKQQKQVSD